MPGTFFGVTAGAVFSVPAYLSVKELNQARAALEQAQSQTDSGASGTQNSSSLSTTTNGLTTSNAAYAGNQIDANIAEIAKNCLPSVVSITNKGVTEVHTFFGKYLKDTDGSGSGQALSWVWAMQSRFRTCSRLSRS